MKDWQCPTCGSKEIPDRFKKVREEWGDLSEREKKVVRHLLAAAHLFGDPSGSKWAGARGFWSAVVSLVPSIRELEQDEFAAALPIFPEED